MGVRNREFAVGGVRLTPFLVKETGFAVFRQFPSTFLKTFLAGLLSVREFLYDAGVGQGALYDFINNNN